MLERRSRCIKKRTGTAFPFNSYPGTDGRTPDDIKDHTYASRRAVKKNSLHNVQLNEEPSVGLRVKFYVITFYSC